MEKKLIAFIESLKSNKRLTSLDEASTKQAIVIKMLSLLDWDIFDVDEVKPDMTVKQHVVDYALRSDKMNIVFIDAKKVGEDLNRHQKDILDAAISEGVKLAVLTNGVKWWFYLTFQEGTSDQRRFCSVDLLNQKPSDAVRKLIGLLEKNNVSSGKSLRKAESMHAARQAHVIEKTLIQAWKQLLTRPPDALVKLVNETVEKISGYQADEAAVLAYLRARSEDEACEEIIELKDTVTAQSASYKGRLIQSFRFKTHDESLETWDQLLVKLCRLLSAEYGQDLEKLLWHSVENKFFFRDNPEELRLPANIENTNIYVETALNPDDMVKVARSVLNVFGYGNSDLDITTVAEN
jgi:hypothetical protein